MKTYLLRDPKTVEPQKGQRLEGTDPQTEAVVQRLVAANRRPTLYVGPNVHTDSIAVSLAPGDSTELRRYGLIGGAPDDVLRLAKKLSAAHPGLRLEFWYEAGPHGYFLCRCLRRHDNGCHLAHSRTRCNEKPNARQSGAITESSTAYTRRKS